MEQRVLLLALRGRDAEVVERLLTRQGHVCRRCASGDALAGELEVGAGTAVVTEESLAEIDRRRLSTWLAMQPSWSDFPFILLATRRAGRRTKDALAVLGELGNVVVLERPINGETLTSAVRAALRGRGRQYEARRHLVALETAEERLRALNATLETRIGERTAELARTNLQLKQEVADRERAQAALLQSQKIEAIGQLTGGVAHDFNNLLMVISGGLDMLDRQPDPKRRARLMEGMRQAAQRGAGLTRQLLAFSRRTSLEPESVDLARQIGDMRELLDRSLRGDIHVRLDFDADLWPVEVDRGELELVILNLAVNARDAMPEGGDIVIRAENVAGADDAELGRDFVRLTVIDTGVGIPPEVRHRVFEPFFTTKDIGKGSGLGLPQVYGFAKQSGGGVRIESEIGQGTRVILSLPRSLRTPVPSPRHRADVPSTEPGALSAGHVLLVEDDREVAALVADMLAQLGYAVAHVSSADAALGALANGRVIDVVFSDIMMPGGMNGVDLARELRKRRPDLALLLTSGHAEAARRDAEAEGVPILGKPYLIADLAAALEDARHRAEAGRRAGRAEPGQVADRPSNPGL